MGDKDIVSAIKMAINASDHERARELLREALKNPTAELYNLAAQVALNEQQRESFLQKASELDPQIGKQSVPVNNQVIPDLSSGNQTTDVPDSDNPFIGLWKDLGFEENLADIENRIHKGKRVTPKDIELYERYKGGALFFDFTKTDSYNSAVFTKKDYYGYVSGKWEYRPQESLLILYPDKGAERIFNVLKIFQDKIILNAKGVKYTFVRQQESVLDNYLSN